MVQILTQTVDIHDIDHWCVFYFDTPTLFDAMQQICQVLI